MCGYTLHVAYQHRRAIYLTGILAQRYSTASNVANFVRRRPLSGTEALRLPELSDLDSMFGVTTIIFRRANTR